MSFLIKNLDMYRNNQELLPEELRIKFSKKLILVISELDTFNEYVNYLADDSDLARFVVDVDYETSHNHVEVTLKSSLTGKESKIYLVRFSRRYNIDYVLGFLSVRYLTKDYDAVECLSEDGFSGKLYNDEELLKTVLTEKVKMESR